MRMGLRRRRTPILTPSPTARSAAETALSAARSSPNWSRSPGGRSARDAPRADIGVGVPPADAADLDHVPAMRRMDELIAADVETDVAEAVEEDEVARLEVAAGDRDAHVPLGA